MKENKNPTDAATSAGAGTEKHRAGTVSKSDFTMKEGEVQGPISKFLLYGQRNAQTARQIAQIAGSKPRDVTRCIQKERAAGAAICASGDGFYVAADAPELARYIKAFDRRLGEMARTRRGLEVAYCRITGQETLEGFQ